jgi:hypothetical protein
MGTLLSIHRDAKNLILMKYLNKHDRTMLLWAVGIKKILTFAFFSNCVSNGYINLMNWVEHGRVDTVKEWIGREWEDCNWASDKIVGDYSEPVSYIAIRKGNIEVLKWMHARDTMCFSQHYRYAAENATLQTLKWLYFKYSSEMYFDFQEVANGAIEGGKLDVLIWIKEEHPLIWKSFETIYPDDDDNMIDMIVLAFDCGHLEIFKWFAEIYPDKINREELLDEYYFFTSEENRQKMRNVMEYLMLNY